MTDVHAVAIRKKNMSAIKCRNTKPEVLLGKLLHKLGFRYRRNGKGLPGKPDLVFPKYKAVIFVNGCFWHMHSCKYFVWPKTRAGWWRDKITTNHQRDLIVQDKLREMGWRVLVVWECAIKAKVGRELLIASIAKWLEGEIPYTEFPAPELNV